VPGSTRISSPGWKVALLSSLRVAQAVALLMPSFESLPVVET